MTESYPNCPRCGPTNWHGGGGQFGPTYQFTRRMCGRCGMAADKISRDGYTVLLLSNPKEVPGTLLDAYINGPLVIMARDYKARWEALQKAEETARYNALLTQWGVDPTLGCQLAYTDQKRPDGGYKFVYRHTDGTLVPNLDYVAFRAATTDMWDAHPRKNPTDILPPLDPVQIPNGVTAFIYRGMGWELVTTTPYGVDALPPDPLRQQHDAFFKTVFDAVTQATGATFNTLHTPNRYANGQDTLNSEPWFTFDILGAQFTMGPRKRVINIEVTYPGPRDVTPIRDVALADNVTYDADGGYKSPRSEATHVTVHAWSQAKTIEYLTLMIRGTRT